MIASLTFLDSITHPNILILENKALLLPVKYKKIIIDPARQPPVGSKVDAFYDPVLFKRYCDSIVIENNWGEIITAKNNEQPNICQSC